MRTLKLRFLVIGGFVGAAYGGQAVLIPWQAFLDGSQEVPPNGSRGTGEAFGTYDTDTNLVTVTSFVVRDLSGPPTATHFHEAPFGSNGPVRIDMLGANGHWNDNGDGSFTYVQDGNLMFTSEDHETAFLAGNAYINVHTGQFPPGEIRGQVEIVPEPATLAALGLGCLALARRRRK